MTEIIWRPTQDAIEQTNVWRFMQRHRIPTYDALIARSTTEIEWFWDAAVTDLGIEWFEPYRNVLDLSRGQPWARWFSGGRINIAHNCVDRHARLRPEQPAILWEDEDGSRRRLSYRELNHAVERLAAGLAGLGVRRGDTVSLYLPICPEVAVAFYAALKLGAIVIPVFSGFGADAVADRVAQAEAKVVITADGTRRRGQTVAIKAEADRALAAVTSVQHVVVVRRLGLPVPWRAGRDHWLHDLMDGATAAPATVPMEAEDPALILYTSGTTGRPKGCVHTHAGCLAQIGKELGYHFDLKPDDRFFWLTDIGWMMGPWMLIGVHLFGAAVVLYDGAPNHPGPDRLWRLIEHQRVSIFGIAPTAIRVLMRAGDGAITPHDLGSLRLLGSTGEPWDPESYRWFFRQVGGGRLPIINISGGTEIIGCFLAPLPITPLKPCTVGGPGLGMDVDVFDDDGRPVRGTTGHLVCKQPAPSMTRGFWNDPERYLQTYWSRFPNVWFHGDWALIDADGYWFLHGRSDDTIKIAGHRTGPAEVEAALLTDPAVSEAAAIGVPDPVKGAAVIGFVVLKPDRDGNAELAQALAERVAQVLGKPFRPKEIRFVAELPKTRSAKIVRRVLRARYLGEPLGDLSTIENPGAIDQIPPASGSKSRS